MKKSGSNAVKVGSVVMLAAFVLVFANSMPVKVWANASEDQWKQATGDVFAQLRPNLAKAASIGRDRREQGNVKLVGCFFSNYDGSCVRNGEEKMAPPGYVPPRASSYDPGYIRAIEGYSPAGKAALAAFLGKAIGPGSWAYNDIKDMPLGVWASFVAKNPTLVEGRDYNWVKVYRP